MAMDVNGKNPTSKVGEYFKINVWWWRPLADYCNMVAPDICDACIYWHSNDGDGLDGKDSVALADAIQAEIDSGRCQQYADARAFDLASKSDESCAYCGGTGIRSDVIGVEHGQTTRVINHHGHPRHGQTGWCNACDGKGYVRPNDTYYPFSVENVQAFINFLRACGGFKIC